ncbi:MAG: ParB-like nuclease domain-containing protein [Thermoguttaceae bacterium]|nr:ParB-like nuclease domain-containing protein [Thermoguttaceae bacterium]
MEKVKEVLEDIISNSENPIQTINEIKEILFQLSPEKENPVDRVLWVPIEKVRANNYNPNTVAPHEMHLLYTSIREDGYTQPVVVYHDAKEDKFIIVDGFHRNLIVRKYRDIYERNHGLLPIVVIDKAISDRMASTVRHNRARGAHSLNGMTNIIYQMMKDGKSEYEICSKLGIEPREFVKLKYITGFAKIFKGYEYEKAIERTVKLENVETGDNSEEGENVNE